MSIPAFFAEFAINWAASTAPANAASAADNCIFPSDLIFCSEKRLYQHQILFEVSPSYEIIAVPIGISLPTAP